ncbi:MAG: hypothetical protein ACE5G6_02930 [Terriglobia bacterium]
MGSPLNRLRHWVGASAEVSLVVEIAGNYVAALRHRLGRVDAWAVRGLAEGAVRPGPLAENITDRAAVREALEHVVGPVADGARRCVLLVPDLLARVAVLEFDHWPERAEEADALLRWRLSKDLPFDVAQAVLAYQAQPGRGQGREALVAVCLRPLLRQYEECVEALGVHPGWVTLSTLAALGWLGSNGARPQLLVKPDASSLGLAIAHGGAVRLFRTVPAPKGSGWRNNEEALFDKIYPAVVYFQEQWGQPVGQSVLASPERSTGSLGQRLEQELGCAVTEVNPAGLDLPPSPVSGSGPDHRLTPALGWARGEAG